MALHSVELSKVAIRDPFWSKQVDLLQSEILPYQWEALNDRIEGAPVSHCIENFKIAAGRSEGNFYGEVFQDTDVAKWLEAVGYSLACHPDAELEKTADEVIDLIADAQCEDGYLNTCFTIRAPEMRWTHLAEGHELYTAGHMIEAAIAYYQGTGKRKMLDCMCRFADLIVDTFGPGIDQIHGYPGHEEIEIALIRLWQVTGEKKYLDQAKYFIDIRGVGENYFLDEMSRPNHKVFFADFENYNPAYSQSHLPVRDQKTAEGHAVRAVYMCCAMADLADAYQDESLKKACETLWDNIVTKRMYLTGGIGSSGKLERFTTDYDLPNEYNYCESCASIGLALFGLRMNRISKEGRYMDVAERALYNSVLGGISLDGKNYFYVNPLEVWPDACMEGTSKEHVKPVRQKWFSVACCPTNIARTLASLGQYVYAVDDEERDLYVNLFVSNEADVSFGDEDPVHVSLETRFPWTNELRLSFTGVKEDGMTVRIRIPDYAKNYRVFRGETPVGCADGSGYWSVPVEGNCDITVSFEAPAHFVYANPEVRRDEGKTAIVRGPLVYCLEECDNGANLPAISADTNAPLSESDSDLFGGCVTVQGTGRRIREDSWTGELYGDRKPESGEVSFTAIPYPYWNNRGPGEMLVWLRAQ